MEWLQTELLDYWETARAFLSTDPSRLMEPDMLVRISLQVVLFFGSAFFSGSETALFSLSRLDLQKLRRERNAHSETLHELLDQPRRLIISILCGNELVNIAAAANMTGILVVLYGDERGGWVNLLVMVPLLLLFGEVTPKTISVSNPVRISTKLVATPMSLWVKFITPLRVVIRGVADRATTLIVGEEREAENILQVDEFRTLVEAVAKGGELDATERALIYNLLEAGDTEIVEIMAPRTKTFFIDVERPIGEIIEQFKAARHPRVPVFREHRDNVLGFLHAEDILRMILSKQDLTAIRIEDIMRPLVVAPLTKKVDEMFDFFQAKNARAAVVLNEFGGVEGIITIRDVLNFIFAETSGEVASQRYYQERDENYYEVPGDMKLTDFNDLTNFGIEDPRMTTIGGVAFRHLDRLPRVGDTVTTEEGIVITVLEMDAHRIAKVRVSRTLAVEEAAEEAARQVPATTESDAGSIPGEESEQEPGTDADGAPRDNIPPDATRTPAKVTDSHAPPDAGASPENTDKVADRLEN